MSAGVNRSIATVPLLHDGMLEGNFFKPVADCAFPIYFARMDPVSLFYTPGYIVAVENGMADLFAAQLTQSQPRFREAALLIQSARSAAGQWHSLHAVEEFAPFCLTVYTSQRCNLNCAYCFSHVESDRQDPDVSADAILKAAEITARSCRRHGQPFSFVVHGGGEPLLDPRLPDLTRSVRAIAAAHGLPFHSYLATNGIASEALMRWAAETFDEIGLSCDGPDDIQNSQRPRKDGGLTAESVRKSAAIMKDAGKKLQVRATVTANQFARLPEIIEYLARVLHADSVRVEPVFGCAGIYPEEASDAAAFCRGFLQAKLNVADLPCEISISGSRIDTIHGRYCQVFRHVLQVVPGDGISACFMIPNHTQALAKGLSFDPRDSELDALVSSLRSEDPACLSCFNRFHCSRGCPDRCPLDGDPDHDSFRCLINRTLAAAAIVQFFESRLAPLMLNTNVPYAGMVM